MKSARGARFTRGGGPGECHPPRLSAKIPQNSLFAILACPSAKPADILREPRTREELLNAINSTRVSLSDVERLLLRAPERGQFDSLGHC